MNYLKRVYLLHKWLPAFMVMAVIFYFSSRTSNQLPDYGMWDMMVKKGGHVSGYLLLSLADHYWFDGRKQNAVAAALAYAFLDEFHQMFTEGRHPSMLDVIVFDGLGIWIGSAIYDRLVEFIRTQVRIPHH